MRKEDLLKEVLRLLDLVSGPERKSAVRELAWLLELEEGADFPNLLRDLLERQLTPEELIKVEVADLILRDADYFPEDEDDLFDRGLPKSGR